MNYKHTLFVISFAISSIIQASESHSFRIEFNTGADWTLESSTRENFRSFLDTELNILKDSYPELYWPNLNEGEHTFQSVFLDAFFPLTPNYKNRDFQCNFLKAVRSNLTGDTSQKFDSLTQNGDFCTQLDLPEDQRVTWTSKLMMFFWDNPWIPSNNKLISLETIIKQKTGIKNYKRPEIMVGTRIEYDGYAWGYSKEEIELFESVPVLQRYREIGLSYDPNNAEEFNRLGTSLGDQLVQNPYGFASTVSIDSNIYISPSVAPSDIVELLVHEYAHIYQGILGKNIHWDEPNKSLKIYTNSTHNEAVAESFTWLIIQEVYEYYPRVKFLHLAKLRLFQQFRENDPHLVGAAGLANYFHFDRDFEKLEDLAKDTDFELWLEQFSPSKLEKLNDQATGFIDVQFD